MITKLPFAQLSLAFLLAFCSDGVAFAEDADEAAIIEKLSDPALDPL